MKLVRYLLPTVKTLFLWIGIFAFYKAIFIIVYHEKLTGSDTSEILGSFYHGLKLDFSMGGYLVIIPLVFSLLLSANHSEKVFHFLKTAHLTLFTILLSIYSIAVASEIGTYAEWEGKLSAKVLLHLQHPTEVFAVASPKYALLFFCTLIPVLLFGTILYRKWIYNKWIYSNQLNHWKFNIPTQLISIGICILLIRGGTAAIPIQLSNAYYSSNQFLNDVSTNTLWSFGHSIIDSRAGLTGNPYSYMDANKAKAIVENLYHTEQDTTIRIIATPKPNVVFIMLESWTADVVESLGGYEEITPNFHHLTQQGLLFTQFYAAGWTSDQAMSAIYSSAVVFPNFAVINSPEAFKNIPSIFDVFHNAGYHSSYFYGGQLEYGNIKGYLINKGVQKIKEGNDFDSPSLVKGKMGIHDGDMANVFLNEINQLKEPFFTNWFTLSSHSPYDQPSNHSIDWAERDDDFLNSVAYSDSCLGIFFNEAKKQSWYTNTLFVIMADHGHVSPRNWKYGSSQKLRIPCLLYGEVLKDDFKGAKQAKIGGNLDVASTLLHQLELGFTPENFPFSKNLLNPYSVDFAPFTMHNGYGWKSKDGEYAFSIASQQDVVFEDSTASVKETVKAYFQVAFEHFYKL